MTTGIEKAFPIGSVLALVLFVVSGAMLYQNTTRLVGINHLVEHAQEVLVKQEAVQSTLDEAVSIARNYILTGDVSNLDRMASSKTNIAELLRLVHLLTADDPIQQKWLQQLEPQLLSTYEYWGEAVAERRRGESAAADQLLSSAAVVQSVRDDRRIIVEMIREENQLLGIKLGDAEASARRAILIELFLAGATLAVLGISYLFVRMDMNQKRSSLQALRQSEESYRRLVELSPDAMWVHRQGTIVFANSACAALLAASSVDELLGKQVLDFVNPGDREIVKQRIQELFERKTLIRIENRLVRLDGKETSVEAVACSVIYQGEPAGQVMFRDIGERKLAEQKLRQSEANLAIAQQIAHLGSFEQGLSDLDDLDKNPLHWSDEVFRIFGYEPGEIKVTRVNFLRAVHPDDRDRVQSVAAQAIRERKSFSVDYRIARPDGTERFIHALSDIISDENTGRPLRLLGTVQDITAQRQLETQYRQAQKMEAVGRLSGGIAHDFNNLLSVIIGYSEILEERLDQTSGLQKNARQINEAAQRAASLTRQLLAFSRQQVLEPKVIDLNAVVVDTGKMLRRLIGEDIELTTVLAPELGSVKADQGQIGQVIMNLAVNSRDAMPHGGKLTIATANVEVDDTYVRQHGQMSPGSFIMLAVSDTGIGMDAETQSHIFEPFFTTKEPGKGTGLGLATVYGVVKQSGGFIWAYSEPGNGTTFQVLLPRVREQVLTVAPLASSERSRRGSETILLVEDEESLRELTLNLLTKHGYTVLEAANGFQALDVARQFGNRIHLLLTDVVMPGMSGPQVAEKLVSLYPEMIVLYMSGYTEFAAGHSQIPQHGRLVLQKPFTQQDLARKVREALEVNSDSAVSLRD